MSFAGFMSGAGGAALVQGATNVISSVGNGLFNMRGVEKQYKYNMRGLQAQNQMSQENRRLWDTPEAQRRMIEQANMSVGMMYGGGGGSGVGGQNPNLTAPQVSAPSPMNMQLGLSMSDIQKALAEAEKAREEAAKTRDERLRLLPVIIQEKQENINLIKASTLNTEEQTKLTMLEEEWQNQTNEILKNTTQNQIDMSNELLRKATAEADISEEEAKQRPEMLATELRLKNAHVKQCLSQAKLNNVQAEETRQRIEYLNMAQFNYLMALTANNNAQTETERVKYSYYNALTDVERKEVEKLGEEIEILKKDNNWYEAKTWADLTNTYSDSFNNVAEGISDFMPLKGGSGKGGSKGSSKKKR